MKKNILIMIAALAVISVLLVGGYFYLNENMGFKNNESRNEAKISDDSAVDKGIDAQETAADSATKGTLPSIQTNPLEDKPELNPVEKTNPYKDIKTNPFK